MNDNHPALIAYPSQAAFGKIVHKNKIYEHSKVNTRLKDMFVKQVDQIVWQYKLAPETINLPSRPDVAEIQIFKTQLKTAHLHPDILRSIDRVVQFPILFELHHGQGDYAKIKIMMAYKRRSATHNNQWVLSSYFASDWIAATAPRTTMPLALDMSQLYAALLQCLEPLPPRANEALTDWVTRVEMIMQKQRAIKKIEAKLLKTKQFNHKMETHALLKQQQKELAHLTAR